jgi:peptidoglycan/xylan/chitin deacetylase (PgdA/CDA1 family)
MRRVSIGIGLLGLLLLAGGWVLWTVPDWLMDWLARSYPGCLYRVGTQEPRVALTIDDGPDSRSTPLILEELRRHGARATFFLIAERVRGREQLVRMLTEEGHELGNHGTRDRPAIRSSPGAFEDDLLAADRVLARFGTVSWVRPGSGWYSREMIEIIERHGYRCALGSVYPYDAAIPSRALAARFILRNVRPGGILILHDGDGRGRRTAGVLRDVLPELRRRGYRVVSLSELAGLRRPDGLR